MAGLEDGSTMGVGTVDEETPVTLPKTNIAVAPENRPSQPESSLPTTIFQGLCQFLGSVNSS